MLPRRLAHLRLGHAAQRKQRPRQLLLRQPEEKVRLVLGQVRRPLQNPAPALLVVLVHRVVAGGDALRADAARRLQQLIELEMVVAERAGNRRAPGQVLIDKRPHHVALEPLLLVDHVIRNAQVLGHVPRVVHIVNGTAAARLRRVRNAVLACEPRLIPKMQRQPDDALRRERARIAAAVEESTPPDMATAIVVGSVIDHDLSALARSLLSLELPHHVQIALFVDRQRPD